jgi:flagellar hook protein FlgE
MAFGALYSAISGLKGHLFSMDVIGNNIANSNTPGYKSNRTTFREALVQTLHGASAPTGNLGGQNALQLGLGMEVASVNTDRTQGVLQSTGILTDLAVDGDGYFVLANGNDKFYTRAGTFTFDKDGSLVNRGTGHVVQGWLADSQGKIPTGAPLEGLHLPLDLSIPGTASTAVGLKANLDASATDSVASLNSAGTTGITKTSGKAKDGAGGQHAVTITGQGATSSTAAGANLSVPGGLTGVETLASLGITNTADFTLAIDGQTPVTVTGLTGQSTVADLIQSINSIVKGATASIVNGEVQLSRDKHGAGNINNIVTSNGAAGNITRQLFGAGLGSSFQVNNGVASTLQASDVFTATGGQPSAPVSLTIHYDEKTGIADGLEKLAGGDVEIGSTGGLAAGTATIDTASTEHKTSTLVYDSLGNAHTLNMTFTRTATPGLWSWKGGFDGSETITSGSSGSVQFNNDGSMQSWAYDGGADSLSLSPDPGAAPMNLKFDAGTASAFDGLTQLAGSFTARASAVDGSATGSLSSLSIDPTGLIAGHFTNGVLRTLGQVVLARFNNADGLERVSGSLYQNSLNTGDPIVGAAGSSIPASIQSGSLEASNVDLSEEFVSMIVAQRGFQANARVITTSDQIMSDLINLKQ